jgi:phage host-nuclease inhibitor protein Gam
MTTDSLTAESTEPLVAFPVHEMCGQRLVPEGEPCPFCADLTPEVAERRLRHSLRKLGACDVEAGKIEAAYSDACSELAMDRCRQMERVTAARAEAEAPEPLARFLMAHDALAGRTVRAMGAGEVKFRTNQARLVVDDTEAAVAFLREYGVTLPIREHPPTIDLPDLKRCLESHTGVPQIRDENGKAITVPGVRVEQVPESVTVKPFAPSSPITGPSDE